MEAQGKIIKEEMERPLDFSRCSLRRRSLSIPCELEIGENYQDFKKFKFDFSEALKKPVEMKLVPKNVTEEFTSVDIPADTKLDSIIYSAQEYKRSRLEGE